METHPNPLLVETAEDRTARHRNLAKAVLLGLFVDLVCYFLLVSVPWVPTGELPSNIALIIIGIIAFLMGTITANVCYKLSEKGRRDGYNTYP